jgi:phage-related protein
MAPKPLQFLGSALDDLRGFPDDARREAGHQLHQVQHGLEPADWKPMTSVGPGVREIRVHTATEHRVLYVAKFGEASTCCTPLRSAPSRRGKPIWTWPGTAIRNCSTGDER